MGLDLNKAKKIGVYLLDQKLIKSFYRIPIKSVDTEFWVEYDGVKYFMREKDGLNSLSLGYLGISDITEIKGLDKLKDLEYLALDGNKIKEITGLETLTNLKHLDLSYNKISELKNLNNQINLRVLWVIYNQITEIKGLDNLTELVTLDLTGNKIIKITSLDKLTKLVQLYLKDNSITEITGLDNLISLRELNLASNRITEIKGLGGLIRLSKLWLYDNLVYKTAKKKFGIVKLGRYFKDPQLLVKWCQLNDTTEIQKLASLYDKITYEEIALRFETDSNDVKRVIEDMIVNGVLNASISGDTLIFQKALVPEPTVKAEKTQVEIESETKKGKLAFISYATKDADLFKISKIAKELTKLEEIDDVLYWQEDMHDNIIKYMNDNLGNCNVVLLFCSPNALKSIPVEKEWTAADALGKPIIPVFIKTEHIPPLLSSRLGIEYDTFNFQKNIKNLYDLILKKSP